MSKVNILIYIHEGEIMWVSAFSSKDKITTDVGLDPEFMIGHYEIEVDADAKQTITQERST